MTAATSCTLSRTTSTAISQAVELVQAKLLLRNIPRNFTFRSWVCPFFRLYVRMNVRSSSKVSSQRLSCLTIRTAPLQDTSGEVIEVLSAVTSLFCGDPESFVASLSLAISNWPATETLRHDEIFHRILFPFLLITKSRQKTGTR